MKKANKMIETSTEENLKKATFAGGCFWCMEPPFEQLEGVVNVISGYTGGTTEDPTYKEVSTGSTGHYEAIQILYDPKRIAYADLLEVFWRHIDPTDPGGQFVDRGSQYRTAIFYHDATQRKLAEASKKKLEHSGRFEDPIVTKILPFKVFYKAEEYHQDFYEKCPLRYRSYKRSSGRETFLEEVWGNSRKKEDE